MALELRIAGPGLDVVRRVERGDPPLVLGRGTECTVCLPDPQRNVSRRHLSVWSEDDELHFQVLSIVNGVQTAAGELPPGASGVLRPGEELWLAAYSLTVQAAPGDERAGADPWAVLDRGASGGAAPPSSEPDPFGDWGFQTTFGADIPSGGGLQASGLAVAQDISSFFAGLGLDPAQMGPLSQGELEAIGRTVRTALLGVLELHRSARGSKQALRAEDRTLLAQPVQANPLKEADWPPEAMLRYLCGGRAASAAFLSPERAVREVVGELLVHEKATAVAARAVVEAVLREFAPDALKEQLLVGGARLFESARAWDAYARHYSEQQDDLARWAQRLLDKHFTEAYVRESERLKREPPAAMP